MSEKPKVYLSGSYLQRVTLANLAGHLRDQGVIICTRWLDGRGENMSRDGQARMDLEDIRECDVLVHIAPGQVGDGYRSGGRHVELGYALAFGKPIIHVGQAENVFHDLSLEVAIVPAGNRVADTAPRLAEHIVNAFSAASAGSGWPSRESYRAQYPAASRAPAQAATPAPAPIQGQHWSAEHGIVAVAAGECAQCSGKDLQDRQFAALGRQFAGLIAAASIVTDGQ